MSSYYNQENVFIYTFVDSTAQPKFLVYFMPNTLLDTGGALVNGIDEIPTITEPTVQWGRI